MLFLMMSFFLFMIYKNKNSLLSCLLMLEGLMLSVLYFMLMGVSIGITSYSGLMAYMYIVVVEGCFGLGLLVVIVRGVGKDSFLLHNFM